MRHGHARLRLTLIGATALAGLAPLGLPGCAADREGGKEVKMRLDEVPPPVREALEREAGGAPIGSVEREQEHGKTVYEATITTGGRKREIEVDEQGNVLPEEEEGKNGDDKEDKD